MASRSSPAPYEELLEALGKSWSCGDEVSGAGGDRPVRVERDGEGIAVLRPHQPSAAP